MCDEYEPSINEEILQDRVNELEIEIVELHKIIDKLNNKLESYNE